MRRTASATSGGRCRSPTRPSSVRVASALEATRRLRSSVPSSSTTPAAAPPSTRIRATGAPARISAPAARAAAAIASRQRAHAAAHVAPHAAGAVAPRPSRGGTARRRCPAWTAPPTAPMIASVASVAFSCVRLEPAVEDVARGAGEDLDRSRPVAAEPQEAQAEPREPQRSPQRPEKGSGGVREQRRLDRRRDPLEHRLVLREPLRVARGELRRPRAA